MIKEDQVVIIIPHYGASEEMCYALKQTVNSLKENSPDIERLVVKNGGFHCDCFYDIKIWGQGQELAVNAGVAITNTPWIFVTNDDMVYFPGWFEKLTSLPWGTRETYKDDPNKFCISPMLIEPRRGAPTFRVEFFGGAGGDFDKKKWLEFADKWPEQAFPLRTGFNLPFLMKRELWDTIGGYDINYRPFGSNGDSDLEYKIRLAGIQPYQNTNCIVYHFSNTSGTFEPKNQKYWQKNWDYFISKWGFSRTDDGIWTADFHMPTKEEGRIFFPSWEGKYK